MSTAATDSNLFESDTDFGGITAAEVVEVVAGTTFLALLTRGDALDESWVNRTAALIARGISG